MKELIQRECGPWHQGEIRIQQRAGSRKRMEHIGSKFIRSYMPDQHRLFFQQLPMIILGAADLSGDIWASVLFGEPGFITSPDERTLVIRTELPICDPVLGQLQVGSRVGLLGIEFSTKRRNRMNGLISSMTDNDMVIVVEQSYGNCPQYIQTKTAGINPHYGNFSRRDFTNLDQIDRTLIQNADTFFIASGFNSDNEDRASGFDVSHRGGETGFVQMDERGRLLVPDYPGNGFYNTLGNLEMNPHAGLLFLDFELGSALHLLVTVEILWLEGRSQYDGDPDRYGNANRLLRMTINGGCRIVNRLQCLFEPA